MKKLYEYLLILLTAILLAFSFPNFLERGINYHTYFFILFAYIPIFILFLKEDSFKKIFIYSTISISLFYLISLYWLWFVEPMGIFAYIAWFFLSVYLSLFVSIGLLLSKVFYKKVGIHYFFTLPVFLTILEYIREWLISGFPLLTPAQAFYKFTPFLQILKITGVYGLDYLIFLFNLILALFIIKEKINLKIIENKIVLIFVFFLFLFTIMANVIYKRGNEKISVLILQPDIDQNVPWDMNYKKNVLKEIKSLIKETKKNIDLILWPETTYPGILNIEPENIKKVANFSNAYQLIGSDEMEIINGERRYYNSAFLISHEGKIIDKYSKYHLVPFGEYVPFQNVFPFIRKVVRRYGYVSFYPGKKIQPLNIGENKNFGVLICYDGLFPEISRKFVKNGAKFLCHISYETWYGNSPASAQIFTNVLLRAVENNVYIARSVSSGISGIIDNKGKIISSTKLFKKTTIASELFYDSKFEGTFYTFFGDWIVIVFLLIFYIVYARKYKK